MVIAANEKKTDTLEERTGAVLPVTKRMPEWVMPAVSILVIGTDALLAALSFLLAFYLRIGDTAFPTDLLNSNAFAPYAPVLAFAVLVRVASLVYFGVYRFSGEFSYFGQARRVIKAVASGTLLIIAFTFLYRGGFEFREFSYSRGVFLMDFALALGLFVSFHLLVRYVQALVRKQDINLVPTIVVGSGNDAESAIAVLKERRDLGFRPVGVICSDPGTKEIGGLPVVGDQNDLPAVINRLEIQEVIITDPDVPKELLFEAMLGAETKQRVVFRLAPTLLDYLPQKTNAEQIGTLPMLKLFVEPISDSERFLKRLSDVVVAAAALLAAIPLWALIALFTKIDSKGPVFFKQERVGMDGRKFLCYKFRTMFAEADDEVHREAYRRNIEEEPGEDTGERADFGKVRDDPRITRFGRLLRRSSLDETPQLLNVLRGEMSIVGPRPPIPYEVDLYEPWHRRRLDMKPGLTGLWQVSGRNRLSFEEMVRTDIYYIENWSLWLDLKILLLTVPAVIRGDGAS